MNAAREVLLERYEDCKGLDGVGLRIPGSRRAVPSPGAEVGVQTVAGWEGTTPMPPEPSASEYKTAGEAS